MTNLLPDSHSAVEKKKPKQVCSTAFLHLKCLDVPLISTSTGSSSHFIPLSPHTACTIGRDRRFCHFLFDDPRVSRRHCQLSFHAALRKIFISDGFAFFSPTPDSVINNEPKVEHPPSCSRVRVRAHSLNGVFVNGVRVGRDTVAGLSDGDEVLLVCAGNDGVCSLGIRIGFVVQRVVYTDDVPVVGNVISDSKSSSASLNSLGRGNALQSDGGNRNKNRPHSCSPPGKKFYLNRLESMVHGSFGPHTVVSLPELLHPVEGLLRIFSATFTCDVLWFLSHCEIPRHLPVTIACHNSERCWSSSPDKRSAVPYPDFPNLVVVYPPFPEVIAFGNDRTKQGIACHHPKFIVLQRQDSIRVIITSANLVAKQWNCVTNTIWWQDFPCRTAPDYCSLFTQISDIVINQNSKSDFAAQLAGFMASLVIDVPSEAYWITELAKYDFGGAIGHLVASIPGVHAYRNPYIPKSMHVAANQCEPWSFVEKFLGSIEASVVGLSHLFHAAADSNGARLKKLAAFFRNCCKHVRGLSKIVLKRNANIPADANAVSVLVPDREELSQSDCIQLGFLPRNIAKWVAPLWDIGFFKFSGYVHPDEVLAAALQGTNRKVQLILYVSQGPSFLNISGMLQPEHVSAICSLVASIQRCSGLWRLQEVLSRYKWPDLQETDFLYGSSSIGSSVNAQFLAAFSAAAGKRSLPFSESEESDPQWGCWNASQESRSPSIKIIFPTIERVKHASCGVPPSRHILCFSEKTWQRLRTTGILHDAIPHPNDREGYPMHVKVARRRFQCDANDANAIAFSYGWVYCGSHNFSAAAWGCPFPISNSNVAGLVDGAADTETGSKLRICNYELGIIFIVPPPADTRTDTVGKSTSNLDDIILPFVVPAPKYQSTDTPATFQAMRRELVGCNCEADGGKPPAISTTEEMEEAEILDEEEVLNEIDHALINDEEKAYADVLWSMVR
ncbi:uncharacterized protein LOC131159439 isoform X2 [Malania oleifera]|uniref:uncharacterized protein LOC131159439 isoform X2 n=1 Tax=Malania oleifera TaxID=397392 RepID=UPI0025AE5B83|nr:uncharacterized protein LOC131159439 isoform X2 [Malania oleifera]